MSKKGHVISFAENAVPDNWVTPTTVSADCGDVIEGAKPIYRAASIEELIELVRLGKRTSYFCTPCLVHARITRHEKRWLFLISEAEWADKVNSMNSEGEV